MEITHSGTAPFIINFYSYNCTAQSKPKAIVFFSNNTYIIYSKSQQYMQSIYKIYAVTLGKKVCRYKTSILQFDFGFDLTIVPIVPSCVHSLMISNVIQASEKYRSIIVLSLLSNLCSSLNVWYIQKQESIF